MRRVILAIVATAAALVILLSFKTHPLSAGAAPASATGSPAPGGGAGSPGHGKRERPGGRQLRYDRDRRRLADDLRPGPGQDHRRRRPDHRRHRPGVPDGHPARTSRSTPSRFRSSNQEALAAGSAHINTVSGATYTSGGYIGSLQSALDKAGRGRPLAAAWPQYLLAMGRSMAGNLVRISVP